ncbi:hypothetical protein PHAMO_80102 [Magnetospirillum molischianum DSM 120]|uniref:Uncharacterized protein n=1 Tax=Magnetospirillum molischianum DSM 120 TaxID=1150626 RepID=H8FY73_MAGML|nr:hypothetical protein PHAMO_80102 [Magnetospirillum molischianum DSM 120]
MEERVPGPVLTCLRPHEGSKTNQGGLKEDHLCVTLAILHLQGELVSFEQSADYDGVVGKNQLNPLPLQILQVKLVAPDGSAEGPARLVALLRKGKRGALGHDLSPFARFASFRLV